mgnify:CR=1 FL=1
MPDEKQNETKAAEPTTQVVVEHTEPPKPKKRAPKLFPLKMVKAYRPYDTPEGTRVEPGTSVKLPLEEAKRCIALNLAIRDDELTAS